MPLVAQRLAPLFYTSGAGGKQQVALYTRFIGLYQESMTPHRLQYLQRKGTYRGVSRFLGGSARAVKGVLVSVYSQTQTTIEDAEVSVAAHPHTEIKAAVLSMPVIPVTIIEKTIASGGMKDRLCGLVNRIIIKFG